jgi:hypothetical protein
VHYDTVLVKKIVLLSSKKVSAVDFNKAQRRLNAAKAFQLQVRVWFSYVKLAYNLTYIIQYIRYNNLM